MKSGRTYFRIYATALTSSFLCFFCFCATQLNWLQYFGLHLVIACFAMVKQNHSRCIHNLTGHHWRQTHHSHLLLSFCDTFTSHCDRVHNNPSNKQTGYSTVRIYLRKNEQVQRGDTVNTSWFNHFMALWHKQFVKNDINLMDANWLLAQATRLHRIKIYYFAVANALLYTIDLLCLCVMTVYTVHVMYIYIAYRTKYKT